MTAPVQPGEVLAGKYRVERILGMGGMGVVVSAWHLQLEERVALKFMLPDALENQEAVSRFSREARAAVKIKSEHVARVSDVGKLENGAPYMVMEFLEGEDLHHLLERTGPLSVEQTIDFVLQACEAIAEAHSIGIVHRDLKPSNLFVVKRRDGTSAIKVLDFGISKTTGVGSSGSDLDMTRTSAVMGSPLYMSPEQLESAKNVDQRSDIWAIGITIYELLSGAKPFGGDTLPELVLWVMSKPPTALAMHRAGIPPALEAVIVKCLEKDRSHRYQNVGQLAEALLPFAPRRSRISVERISGILHSAGLGGTALAAPPSSLPPPDSEPENKPSTVAAWGQTAPKVARGKRTLAGLAVLGAIAAAAVGAVLLLSRHPEETGKDGTQPSAAAAHTAAEVAPTAAPTAEPTKPAEPVAATGSAVSVTPAPETAAPVVTAAPAVTAAPVIRVPPKPGVRAAKPVSSPPKGGAPAEAPRPAAPEPAKPASPPANTIFDDRK